MNEELTRRLATVVMADVVGYSRQMERDESGTIERLRSMREEVVEPLTRRFRGRVVDTAGDGWLAEFSSVTDAVLSSLAIQEAMNLRNTGVPPKERFEIRIGVTLGEIVFQGGAIFGTGVNVAARLQALAEPGGICVSGAVYDQLQGLPDIVCDDLGEQQVKNIAKPIHCYAIRVGVTAAGEKVAIGRPPLQYVLPVLALVVLLGVALLARYWYAQQSPSRETATSAASRTQTAGADAEDRSIAVLPFVSMSSDQEQEYFADGLSEELLNLLAKVPQLRVIARTSSFSFKGKDVEVAEIGRRLGVAHVLEGSVRRSGDMLRITVQLIRTSDSTNLWSQVYERKIADVFEVQDAIASAVTSELKIKLLGVVPKVRATDPRAYALFQQARQLGLQATPEGFERSIELFKQALAVDPNYAAAWAYLAGTYANQAGFGLRPVDEGYRLARDAANRALSIDADFAPAHAALAWIAMSYEGAFATAALHFDRALSLEPTDADTMRNAAVLASYLGRFDLAVALAEYVALRDPVNPTAHANLGACYLYAGRYDEAIASYRTALSLSPGYGSAEFSIGEAMLLKGDTTGAMAAMQREADPTWRAIGLPMALYAAGRTAESDAALAELIRTHEKDASYNIAYVLAFRGEADRAFDWLEKAVTYHDPGLSEIAVARMFENIYADPRWTPLLRKLDRTREQLDAIQLNVVAPT